MPTIHISQEIRDTSRYVNITTQRHYATPPHEYATGRYAVTFIAAAIAAITPRHHGNTISHYCRLIFAVAATLITLLRQL